MAIIHQTIQVPHLGGITAGYALSNGGKYDSSKPTVVFINSMNTTVDLYQKQFESSALTEAANLLAIEPLGHGATSCPSDQFTYWDTATMALQVIEKLGIDKVFAVGTSQGGWMVVRMALLAPEKVVGLLPLGTSMDCESADSRSKGCWDPKTLLMPKYEQWCSPVPTPDFVVDDEWCGMVGSLGFGSGVSAETIQFWHDVLKRVYRGDEGRRKLRMALACLIERDGLLLRLRDIKCPVYWLQGTEDVVYGKTVPQEHIAMFTSSKETKLEFLEGGGHYLNATNPAEVEKFILEMVNKYK